MNLVQQPVDTKPLQKRGPPDRNKKGGELGECIHLCLYKVKQTGRPLDHIQDGHVVLPARYSKNPLPCHSE